MAKQNIIRLTRSVADNPVVYADQPAGSVYYILPAGAPVQSVDKPVRFGYARYTGTVAALSTDCGVSLPPANPGPVAGGPAWKADASFPDLIPGQPYDFVIPDGIGIPAAGQTIGRITADVLPGWLSLTARNLSAGIPLERLQGNPPANAVATSMTLRLVQSDGKSTPQSFPINVTPNATLDIYALLHTETPNRVIRPHLGGASANLPTVQIVKAPPGWSNFAAYLMERFVANFVVTGKEYYFRYLGYSNAPDGEYVMKFSHNGKVAYGTGTMTGGNLDTGMVMSAVPPTTYAVQGLATLGEGNTTVYELIDNSTGSPVVIADATATLENARTGTTVGNLTRQLAAENNLTTGDSYSVTVVLTKGAIVARRIVTIGDTTPTGPATGFGTPTHYESFIAP